MEAAHRFADRLCCPHCEGRGGWAAKDAPAVLDCIHCNGKGWLRRKTLEERLTEAGKYVPANFAVLLGALIAHADFLGLQRVWHWDEQKRDGIGWVVTLWPRKLWRYHTQPKASIIEAILDALQYLENPIEPRGISDG